MATANFLCLLCLYDNDLFLIWVPSFLGNAVASLSMYERFPLHSFAINLQGTNNFGYAVDYTFVAPMSADQLSTVVDAYIAGFLVKAEALYLSCRLGYQTDQLSHKSFYLQTIILSEIPYNYLLYQGCNHKQYG